MGDTIHRRPVPKRPPNGWLAWLATVGYISQEHSADAALTLRVYPLDAEGIGWGAELAWAENREVMNDAPSFAAVLRDLWQQVNGKHQIFKSSAAAFRQPTHYNDDNWLDPDTGSALMRIIDLTYAAFGTDWQLIMVYHPTDATDSRVQARLIARENTVDVSGSGASLRDACSSLYRHAAPNYFQH